MSQIHSHHEELLDKKYSHQVEEAACQALWEHQSVNNYDPDHEGPAYTIDTPPPTVSGNLHIGHVFSYTHTDIIARYKRLTGHNVFYPMGFDDNGLPTERYVEKKHKTKAHVVGRSAFIALCQEEVQHAHEAFSALWKQLGLSVDWRYRYSTISAAVRRRAQQSFLQLLANKHVYRQKTPALYCATCQTSVAQAELDSVDKATTFNTLLFNDGTGTTYPIATTRPELLAACVAVFYNPTDSRYTHLAHTTLYTPYYNQPVTCLPDPQVAIDKGTGLVMCCTFGDQTDIMWQQTHKLPIKTIMDERGIWNELSGELAGLRVHDARKKIIALLEEQQLLTEKKPLDHAVNIHERCKQPIEFRVIEQWFVNILDHKQELIALADRIDWKPAFMKSRYVDWVENLGWDWCISRQRFYGVPFPVWHCANCSAILAPTASQVDKLPVDPTEVSYQEFSGTTCDCGSDAQVGETDVMDTWNISSLTPYINRDNNSALTLPFSLRPQAHDIIRTWAFYTIIKSYYHDKQIPWETIAISGHVTAGSKGKISKSAGGAQITPEYLLTTYPADAIRYWAAHGKLGMDTAFSEDQFKVGSRLVTKLWNAFRFMSEHLREKPTTSPTTLSPLNQWLLSRLQHTLAGYHEQFEQLAYSHALERLEQFFWADFCDNYLELVKDQFFNPDKYNEQELRGTRATLYHVGLNILLAYAPVVPHITETLYQKLYRTHEQFGSLNELTYKKVAVPDDTALASEAVALMDSIITLVAKVRRAKSEMQCSLKTPITELTIISAEIPLESFLSQQGLICGVTRAEKILVTNSGQASSDWADTEQTALRITIEL